MLDRRRIVRLLFALAAAAPAGVAMAKASAASSRGASSARVLLFNIPSQPLSSALLAYSAVTGDQVVCDSRLAARWRSSPVVGLFSTQTALRMLVDRTDLIVRYTGPQDITLVSAGATLKSDGQDAVALGGGEPAGAITLDPLHVEVELEAMKNADFSDYARTVRLAVRQALTRDPETADRIYDLQIDIWINRQGRVRQPRLLRSTGHAVLDTAIRRVLAALVIQAPPPAGLSQPIRIAVSAI